jgi:chromate reductase, NAD(P)H dehydrogenase (quinone)
MLSVPANRKFEDKTLRPLLGISGSLRAGSFNTALLVNARDLVAPDCVLDVATLQGIPLYDGDLEQAQGLPPAVVALQERIAASAGVILATPEYNNGIPGVFKNAIDWLSRPATGIDALFGNRPFAVIGATPGGMGTALAQAAWLPVLRMLGVRYWSGGRLMLSRANTLLGADGRLIDDTAQSELRRFVRDFHAFATR